MDEINLTKSGEIKPDSDEALFFRYIDNKEDAALKILLERYREELTFFIFGFLKNMDDAEEIMMDAFAVAASGTARFLGKSSFKTWLFAIGRNLALKSVRRKRFLFIPLNEEITADCGLPELELLRDEKKRILYEALGSINPEYRQALHLVYFEEMSTDEVAAVMKKNKKQVYNLIARGKAALKEALEKRGISGS